MNITYYIVTGAIADQVQQIIDKRADSLDRISKYRQTIKASLSIMNGQKILGFAFDDPNDKPVEWLWEPGQSDPAYAHPQRRNEEDGKMWQILRNLEYDYGFDLNALFYKKPMGFKHNDQTWGVSVLMEKEAGIVVGLPSIVKPKKDMKELYNSEYNVIYERHLKMVGEK